MTKKVGDKLVYEEVFLIDNYIIFRSTEATQREAITT